MKYNILVTSVGGDIGGNIVSILKEQNLFECSIVGVDIKEYVFSMVDLEHFYRVSRIDKLEYVDELINIVHQHKINLIIPSSEYDINFLHKNILLFKKLNVTLLINSKKIVDTFLNKKETADTLNSIGIATPTTYTLQDYNNELEFPLILKASESTTSKMIKIINNFSELKRVRETIIEEDKFIIQEYIGSEDEEYTTALYCDGKEIRVITFKRLLDGDKTGYAEIVNSKILDNYAEQIARTFNLVGSINIQSRKCDNDFFIFEINPRISSTVYIRNHFNFQDLLWWITHLLKIEIDFELIKPFDKGIAIIGYKYRFYKEEK